MYHSGMAQLYIGSANSPVRTLVDMGSHDQPVHDENYGSARFEYHYAAWLNSYYRLHERIIKWIFTALERLRVAFPTNLRSINYGSLLERLKALNLDQTAFYQRLNGDISDLIKETRKSDVHRSSIRNTQMLNL